jgi:CspA family cold shock protein
MTRGKVKWYNDAKGYGFIASEKDEDIFIHRTGIVKPVCNLIEGQEVEFEVKEGAKGLIAYDLKEV